MHPLNIQNSRAKAAGKSTAWVLLFESKLRQLALRVAGDPQCASAQRKRFRNIILSVSGGSKSSFLQISRNRLHDDELCLASASRQVHRSQRRFAQFKMNQTCVLPARSREVCEALSLGSATLKESMLFQFSLILYLELSCIVPSLKDFAFVLNLLYIERT